MRDGGPELAKEGGWEMAGEKGMGRDEKAFFGPGRVRAKENDGYERWTRERRIATFHPIPGSAFR